MHATEIIVIPLTEAEIQANIEESRRTLAHLQQMWASKGLYDIKTRKQILLDVDDVEIPVVTQRLALRCVLCDSIFNSESEADDSPCLDDEMSPPETGVDSYFDMFPAKGEKVHIYGYGAHGEITDLNDLQILEIYLPPNMGADGDEGEGYYAGSDPGEAKVDPDRGSPTVRKPYVRRRPKYGILAMLAVVKAKEMHELLAKKGRNDEAYAKYKAYLDGLRAALKSGGWENF